MSYLFLWHLFVSLPNPVHPSVARRSPDGALCTAQRAAHRIFTRQFPLSLQFPFFVSSESRRRRRRTNPSSSRVSPPSPPSLYLHSEFVPIPSSSSCSLLLSSLFFLPFLVSVTTPPPDESCFFPADSCRYTRLDLNHCSLSLVCVSIAYDSCVCQ